MSRPPRDGDRTGWARSVGVGIGIGVLVALVAIAFVALPLFFLASAVEPSRGLNRPFVRTGLVEVAVPLGCFIGAAVGVTVGVWYHRGGRMPAPDRGSRWGG